MCVYTSFGRSLSLIIEAEVVVSESIRSGNVVAQLIYPGP